MSLIFSEFKKLIDIQFIVQLLRLSSKHSLTHLVESNAGTRETTTDCTFVLAVLAVAPHSFTFTIPQYAAILARQWCFRSRHRCLRANLAAWEPTWLPLFHNVMRGEIVWEINQSLFLCIQYYLGNQLLLVYLFIHSLKVTNSTIPRCLDCNCSRTGLVLQRGCW